MENIFKVLLNRKPSNKEQILLRNTNNDDIKNYIKNSEEFSYFKKKNNEIIKSIFYEITNKDSSKFNSYLYLNHFFNLKFNKSEMKKFLNEKINFIIRKYKQFYLHYLDIHVEISDDEFFDILNNNYDIQIYICTSKKYQNLCEKKINQLLD